METREHYQEISTLIASVAKALGLPDDQVAKDIETGAIVLGMGEDDNGNRFIEARRGAAVGRIFQGAIRYAEGVEPSVPPLEGNKETP